MSWLGSVIAIAFWLTVAVGSVVGLYRERRR
jgi:hypothetical protein